MDVLGFTSFFFSKPKWTTYGLRSPSIQFSRKGSPPQRVEKWSEPLPLGEVRIALSPLFGSHVTIHLQSKDNFWVLQLNHIRVKGEI